MRINAAYTPVYTPHQEQAFSEYLRRHKGIVYALINKNPMIMRHERDDYYQEAVLYAWRRFHLFDRYLSPFANWLHKTAKWGILHYMRFLQRDKTRTYYFENHESWYDVADHIYDESHIESLRHAIDDLPAEDRKYVNLYLTGECGTVLSRQFGKHDTFLEKRMIRIRQNIRDNRHKYFEDLWVDPRKLETISNGRCNELHPDSKPVIMMNLQGRFIKRFPSVAECERQGFSRAVIGNICNGKGYTHRGYRWMYEGETRPEVLEVLNRKPRKPGEGQATRAVDQYDMFGNFLQRFESLKAAKKAGFDAANIAKYIKGQLTHYKGFTWKYPNQN